MPHNGDCSGHGQAVKRSSQIPDKPATTIVYHRVHLPRFSGDAGDLIACRVILFRRQSFCA